MVYTNSKGAFIDVRNVNMSDNTDIDFKGRNYVFLTVRNIILYRFFFFVDTVAKLPDGSIIIRFGAADVDEFNELIDQLWAYHIEFETFDELWKEVKLKKEAFFQCSFVEVIQND